MKTGLKTVLGLLFILMTTPYSGCAVYDAARDERSVGTIVDDDTILARVKLRLYDDSEVTGSHISVYSFEGRVYLVGAIEKKDQGDRAVKIAQGVEGVRSVETYFLDRTQISLGKTMDDAGITTRIKSKLIGDMDIKSTQVEVKTIMGHVVLLGMVGSKPERDRIIAHAEMVPHVKNVKSFILVK